jgi:hypothetical protein
MPIARGGAAGDEAARPERVARGVSFANIRTGHVIVASLV